MLNTHESSNGRGVYLRPSVIVSNNDKRLMNALMERAGTGRVYTHKRGPEENKRPVYTWRLVAEEIRELGPKLLPHLILKQEQMRLLLQYLDAPRAPLGRRLTDTMREERLDIQRQIRALNQTGLVRS